MCSSITLLGPFLAGRLTPTASQAGDSGKLFVSFGVWLQKSLLRGPGVDRHFVDRGAVRGGQVEKVHQTGQVRVRRLQRVMLKPFRSRLNVKRLQRAHPSSSTLIQGKYFLSTGKIWKRKLLQRGPGVNSHFVDLGAVRGSQVEKVHQTLLIQLQHSMLPARDGQGLGLTGVPRS